MSISGGGTPCLYRALFPPDLTFLLLSFSKFGPAQTPAPVSCPPPLPPPSMLAARGAAVDGGPPQSTQKLPKEEILFPLLQAGSCRMFHLEFFGFHVAECSSLDSHWPPPSLLAGNSLAKDVLGLYVPSSPLPFYVCCKQNKICQGTQKNQPEIPPTCLQLILAQTRALGSKNMTVCGPQHDEGQENGEIQRARSEPALAFEKKNRLLFI